MYEEISEQNIEELYEFMSEEDMKSANPPFSEKLVLKSILHSCADSFPALDFQWDKNSTIPCLSIFWGWLSNFKTAPASIQACA